MRHHNLDILLTEATPGDSDRAAEQLAASGHRVHRCHPGARPGTDPTQAGAASQPRCVAWQAGGRCPLTSDTIDLVVDVRTAHGPETAREQGTMCALLAGIPLVVCGPTDTSNSLLLRADVVCRPERLTLACHTALSPVGPTAHRAVTRAVHNALTGLDEAPPLSVHLELRDHTVVADVTITGPPCATTYPRVRAAVRTALAPFTPAWPYTPVTIHHTAAQARRSAPAAARRDDETCPSTLPTPAPSPSSTTRSDRCEPRTSAKPSTTNHC
ncbi:hypothetical protein [Yinghuangia sp. YIM S09857]|uniref:hypothetical protein n=1 Tax=Yinghuangia sp. YIM S09857 TaxID=3436929 RepID=UPI003F5336C9